MPGRAQSWSPDVTLLALSAALHCVQVSGFRPQLSYTSPCFMGTVWSGEMQDNTRQTAEFVSRSCRVLWSGRWGMAIVPAGPSAWPLQTPVLSLSSCKQLLVAPSTSAFKHRSSSQDTSGVHRLWIYCPQFYSMVLTASFITGEKKKIPALPGALSHVFLPADTTHFSVLIPDLSGGGRATLGDHCPRCWKDNGLVSRQPVSSLALPPP